MEQPTELEALYYELGQVTGMFRTLMRVSDSPDDKYSQEMFELKKEKKDLANKIKRLKSPLYEALNGQEEIGRG